MDIGDRLWLWDNERAALSYGSQLCADSWPRNDARSLLDFIEIRIEDKRSIIEEIQAQRELGKQSVRAFITRRDIGVLQAAHEQLRVHITGAHPPAAISRHDD